jgi:hypothetical protein
MDFLQTLWTIRLRVVGMPRTAHRGHVGALQQIAMKSPTVSRRPKIFGWIVAEFVSNCHAAACSRMDPSP